jgi:DNA-binding NtrC family response regulator
MEALERHDWPGNIRELRNAVERAVVLTREGTVQMGALAEHLQHPSPGAKPMALAAVAEMSPTDSAPVREAPVPPLAPAAPPENALSLPIGTTVSEAEKGLILRTLEHTHNNKTKAAEILGISLKTLHNKLKEYGAREEREE